MGLQAKISCMPTLHAFPTDHDADIRTQARHLYWQRWRVTEIAAHLKISRTTIHGWKKAEGWEKAAPVDRVESTLDVRINVLINREHKSNNDYKELDAMLRSMERMARIRKYEQSGRESDLNPNIDRRNEANRGGEGKEDGKGSRKGTRKNHLTEEQVAALERAFLDSLYGYQLTWLECAERIRMILKSRQIGATWYFAREALMDALKTGRNQLFISASKAQAMVFREYMVQFVKDVTGVHLSGETIILSNGAKLRFLGTNSRTAQSYNGNLYIDECFWINQFTKLKDLAFGMASHDKWRITLFSTPSTKNHEAYPLWTGEEANQGRPEDEKLIIDFSAEALRAGTLGGDLFWRQVVTIHDAAAGGCDLFNVERLKIENSPDAFANKYECEFIDDQASAFSFAAIKRCRVDADVVWKDFKRYTERPFGYAPVWVGHDPSYTGDSASLVVVAPPTEPGGIFRVLERQSFRGASFEAQAEALRKITKRYNVVYLAIDVTGGWGQAVYELVVKFFPTAKALQYNLELKDRMVLKAQNVINKKRLQFDAGEVEIAQSFMSIRKALTKSQKRVTWETGRNEQTGHGDAAWAIMHTLINEPLDEATVGGPASVVEMF